MGVSGGATAAEGAAPANLLWGLLGALLLAGPMACSVGGVRVDAGAGGGGGTEPLPSGARWQPALGASWDWQLKTPVNTTSADVDVYDIDPLDAGERVVAELHALGRKVICYVNVGAWEQWRPDAGAFPVAVVGAIYKGFPDERWLDIRQVDVLGPLMRARLDQAREKGCDAVEPDNLDGYDTTAHEPSGFPLSYEDQLRYNRFIAAEAHARGMAVGLKNDINQTTDLAPYFDFAVSEQCFEYDECGLFAAFTAAGKPVFEAEYDLDPAKFCPRANTLQLSAIKKRTSLDSYRVGCESFR